MTRKPSKPESRSADSRAGETAFDGVCNEPGVGDGTCAERTDRADCIGRDRPMGINDHYFGHDDRVFMDTSVFPWTVIGQVDFDAGAQPDEAKRHRLVAVLLVVTHEHAPC